MRLTGKEKIEKSDVMYHLNLSMQLRKLNKEENVILKHLKANVSVLAMCKRYWGLCTDQSKMAQA